jgi:hypothetical protein
VDNENSGSRFLHCACVSDHRRVPQIEDYFLGVQDRFTDEHIEQCLAARKKQGAKYTAISEKIYQPNYFYTCVANTDVGSQKFLEHKPGHYFIAYEVRVPISKPPVVKEPSASGNDKWYYVTRCNFAVEGNSIRFYEDSKVDVFIAEVPVPGLGSGRHICMKMPQADFYLLASRKNATFQKIYKKSDT